MKKKGFLWFLWVIITIVAILHLIRAVIKIPVVFGSTELPIWFSYIAFLILGFISYKLFEFLK